MIDRSNAYAVVVPHKGPIKLNKEYAYEMCGSKELKDQLNLVPDYTQLLFKNLNIWLFDSKEDMILFSKLFPEVELQGEV